MIRGSRRDLAFGLSRGATSHVRGLVSRLERLRTNRHGIGRLHSRKRRRRRIIIPLPKLLKVSPLRKRWRDSKPSARLRIKWLLRVLRCRIVRNWILRCVIEALSSSLVN